MKILKFILSLLKDLVVSALPIILMMLYGAGVFIVGTLWGIGYYYILLLSIEYVGYVGLIIFTIIYIELTYSILAGEKPTPIKDIKVSFNRIAKYFKDKWNRIN